VSAPIPDRPPIGLPLSPTAPGMRSIPPDAGLAKELAALLADVVVLASDSAVFPSRWALIAELALEHDSVRAALRTEWPGSTSRDARTPLLGTHHIIDRLEQLRELVPDRAPGDE
jgi:hypothetical protein